MLQTLMRLIGLRPAIQLRSKHPREIVIVGGYGYGNTGDEAQLGANLARWRDLSPQTECLVLSPNPAYTQQQHGCRAGWASRVVCFDAAKSMHYIRSSRRFLFSFWLVLIRLEISARLMRSGLPPLLASAAENKFLLQLQNASLLHVSGGGFLTGSTRSRLWDTCLLMRLCQHLGTPYALTGQTIGLFENGLDRWLARTGLRGALVISLRDPEESAGELRRLGIHGEHVVSTVDDALFCNRAQEATLNAALVRQGIAANQPYLAVNYHWWGMTHEQQERSAGRLAQVLESANEKYQLPLLLIPMVPSDVEALQSLAARIPRSHCVVFDYAFEYPMVRAAIARSKALISFKHHPLVFGLGESVPCLAIALDGYYERKNDGAMANFGQKRFSLHTADFFSANLEHALDQLLQESAAISDEIRLKLTVTEAQQKQLFEHVGRAARLIP